MTPTGKKLLMFPVANTPVDSFMPMADRLLAGQPAQTVANHYSDATGQFHSGEWTGEPGRWQVRYTEHEFCYVTRGRIAITDADGQTTVVKSGDAFMVPAGFTGVWEVLEPAHKYYVIFEPKPR